MSGARGLYRLAVSLGAAGAIASTLGLLVAARSLALEGPLLEAAASACRRVVPLQVKPASVLLLGLGALGALVVARALAMLLRLWRDQRSFRRALVVAEAGTVAGTRITWIEDPLPRAFCAGLLAPRVHLSTGARERLSPGQLAAVVAHERHHARRRDPLRMLLLAMLAHAVFFMPVLGELAGRYRALAELAADEAAQRTAGRRSLASALLTFGRRVGPDAVAGIAPERVDHLLGRRPQWQLPAGLLAASLLSAATLLALVVTAESVGAAASVGWADAAVGACAVSTVAASAGALGLAAYLIGPMSGRRRR